MLFDSAAFAAFFSVVLVLHRWAPPERRNLLLLIASYFFYGWWNVGYLGLIAGITLADYLVGLRIEASSGTRRKWWLGAGVGANLIVLLAFKYADFLSTALHTGLPLLRLALPLGLSFHALQGIGYAVDVYRGEIAAERNLTRFALFVAFFPQMVAGPIERAGRMLPQFTGAPRVTGDVEPGGWLILRGLIKKVVVADLAAPVVNAVYARPHDFPAPLLLLGTVLFAAQIYCDFSGYSDMAVGLARVLGYELTVNFNQPWKAGSLEEFWRRWHISLSQWFRDYVYIPLGGNRTGAVRYAANVLAVFLLSGLWHGANWTWVAWGGLHGTLLLAGKATRRIRKRWIPEFPGRGLMAACWTNLVVTLCWVPFRSATTNAASWTSAPRAVLINTAVGFIRLREAAPIRWRVRGVKGAWSDRTCACASKLLRSAQGVTPAAAMLLGSTNGS